MNKKALILAGIFWNDTWQRHQQFATYLARDGYEVYFIEHIISSKITFSKVFNKLKGQKSFSEGSQNSISDKIHVISVGFANPQGGVFDIFNQAKVDKLLDIIPSDYNVVIDYLPISTTRFIIGKISYDSLIYDCVRNFSGWTANEYSSSIDKEEMLLCERATQIFTDSYYLTDKMKRLVMNSKEVTQFLPIVDNIWSNGIHEKKVTKIKSVGYFGTLSYLENDLLLYQTLSKSGIAVHFWGKIPSSLRFEHVYHGYQSNLGLLANEIIENCEALVIAYKGNMDGVIPAKLMQALSTGLPVFINSFYDSELLKDRLYVFSSTDEALTLINNYKADDYKVISDNNKGYLVDKNEENQFSKFISTLSVK